MNLNSLCYAYKTTAGTNKEAFDMGRRLLKKQVEK